MSYSRTSPFASRWTGWTPLAVLLLGFACTAAVTQQLAAAARAREQQRFDSTAQLLKASIEQRVGKYAALTRATARMLCSHDGYAGPVEFHRFLDVVRPSDCPGVAGVEGVGFCRRFLPGELPRVVSEIRQRIDPTFAIAPEDPPRGEYFPVVLLETAAAAGAAGPGAAAPGAAAGVGGRRVLGYDLLTDPACRAAMGRARDTGAVAASAVVTAPPLIREEEAAEKASGSGPARPGPEFLLIAPVYKKDARPADAVARRGDLRGLAFVAVRASEAFEALRTDPRSSVAAGAEFAVSDGSAANAEAVSEVAPGAALSGEAKRLYSTPGYDSAAGRSRFAASLPIDVAGRTWTLMARSTPAFEAAAEPGRVFGVSVVPAFAAGGAAVSLLLAGLTWMQVRARGAAGSAARRLDLALRQAESAREQAEAARDRSDRSREHAEGTGRIKDEFLATLSHELRTPLNAILGWVQLLRRQHGLDPSVDEGLAVIERNARVQSQLVSDLLDMSRIIAGKIQLELRPVDVAAVAAAAADSVRPAAEAKGIIIEQVVPEPAAGAADATVWGDGGRLQQVAWNLLSNAVKFTPDGGRVRIAVARTAGPDARVTLTVTDTGEGIPPAFVPHLFNRFSQADVGTTRRHGGLGLGLAVVKHLVELHGGRVRAASDGPGTGSTFTVELPVARHRPGHESGGGNAQGHSAGPAAPPTLPRVLNGLTVLVADDEPDARELARRVLGEAGASVLLAGSADEALRLLRDLRPDVLVGDIGMPGRDGFALARAVRALPEGEGGTTPALALTAFAGADDAHRVLAAGYHVHLPKPAEAAELVAAVARIAGRGKPNGPPAPGSPPEAGPTRRERLGLDD